LEKSSQTQLGFSLDAVNQLIDALPFQDIKDAISDLKKDLLNYILKESFGMSLDDIKAYLTNPELYFDRLMNSSAFNQEQTGCPVTLQTLNPQLGIQDQAFQNPGETFDYTVFPAAYNSVIMIKLSMLDQAGINRLLTDLGSPPTYRGTNAMLGFIETLDGSRQWNSNSSPMVFAANNAVYQKIFMKQPGNTYGAGCSQ
jgi:hypothetical protein